jgi:hypothetical protein
VVLPQSPTRALTSGEAVVATAKDADGTTVARGTGGVEPIGVPTDTTGTGGP